MTVVMLEDEVELALLVPLFEIDTSADPQPCSRIHCNGHQTRAEAKAVHDAIDSCYAAARD